MILKQDKGSGSPERPQPDHLARQNRSLRAFCPLPPPKKAVGWEALGSRPGLEQEISRWQAIFVGVTAGVNERMKKTMAEKDLKRKFALWIRPSLLEDVDSLYKSDNCASRR